MGIPKRTATLTIALALMVAGPSQGEEGFDCLAPEQVASPIIIHGFEQAP